MSSLIEKVPTPSWRWVVVFFATWLVGVVTVYLNQSIILATVCLAGIFIVLWACWLTQRAFKYRICRGWLKVSNDLGPGSVSLSCRSCHRTMVYVP